MANTNTSTPSTLLESALSAVDATLRTRLASAYIDVKKNSLEGRFTATGVAAGHFCEIALRVLQDKVHGNHTPLSSNIGNFADECRRLVTAQNSNVTDSEKKVLPRALVFLYTMRNNRGIGHVGGDVDANAIDMSLIVKCSDWIISEMIRVYHSLSLEEAQDLVDGLAIRALPDVWEVAGKKRVLRGGLKARSQALLLLYSCESSSVLVEDLSSWIEYSSTGMFKTRVLQGLHKDRFIEWDMDDDFVVISPKGAKWVEENLINAQPGEDGNG